MKKFLALTAVFFSMPLFALGVGDALPKLSVLDSGGAPLNVPTNKVVVIDVWASWCAPCKRALPFWEGMQAKYSAQGLHVIALNVDRKRVDADKFLSGLPLKLTLAYDSEGLAAKQLGVVGMPTSFIVDAKQRVILLHGGFKESDKAELEAKLVQALKDLKS